jgi:transposase
MVREYAYVFGAVSPADGHDSLVLPWADTEAISLFLKEVAGWHPDEYILVFMYQAAWHKAKALKVQQNVEPAYLPPYSPELNPQEQVWDDLREKSLANRLFKSLDAVVDAAVEGLRRIKAPPGAVARLTRRDWMGSLPESIGS